MIYCVEDEQNICELEVYTLQSVGLDAKGCSTGKELFEELENKLPQLILLDIMLPDEDGLNILRRLRSDERYAHIPVIMATAKGTEFDKVKGLDCGADDYIAKPFGMLEMVARIKAVLRRCEGRGVQQAVQIIKRDNLEVNLEEHKVLVEGEEVVLTLKEFELLKTFLLHPGRLGVPIEMGTDNGIQLLLLKEPADHLVHCLRHQAFSPIGLGKHKAKGTGSQQIQLRRFLLIIIRHPQRTDHLSPVIQGEGFLFGNEAVQDFLGFGNLLVRQPARHLAHSLHGSVFKKVLQILLPPGTKGQAPGVKLHPGNINGCIHRVSSLSISK